MLLISIVFFNLYPLNILTEAASDKVEVVDLQKADSSNSSSNEEISTSAVKKDKGEIIVSKKVRNTKTIFKSQGLLSKKDLKYLSQNEE